MKKALGTLLVTFSSAICFAGEGSTFDFAMTASLGYELGCANTEELDKVRRTACALGEAMNRAGISKEQAMETFESFSESAPNFDSICK